ncbi:WD40/YVTN/BNR-like repeat-containing protein [Rhodohalobacter sp. 614A]|uniref:WD40/YVTN/BNR-like repeat-containing protein n=1 Tax=Rhodohalobacter sp. 614A TaxID=2908649 RepID=UPI001F40F77C|nr:hypothetical protein [Rhodohalobacter sp. 614A]
MHRFILTISIICSIFLLSCSTSPELGDLSPGWDAHGLEEVAVHSIHERNGKLYAGTDSGVFISNDDEYTSWRGPELDLQNVKYASLALDGDQNIIAALRYRDYDKFGAEDNMLFRSRDDGSTWRPINTQAENWTDGFYIFDIVPQTSDSEVLFGYVGAIYCSKDSGKNWRAVYTEGGFPYFITVSENYPNHIWTGGTLPIFWPYLSKSDDGGKTWTKLNDQVSFKAEATARAASVSPSDPDVVLVGFTSNGPAIRKTTTGGQTWKTVLEDYHVYALQNGQMGAGRVYASGKHPSMQLSVVVSDNYGDDWTTFVNEDGPNEIRVNDMAVANIDGEEMVFLGTNQGLYSFHLNK